MSVPQKYSKQYSSSHPPSPTQHYDEFLLQYNLGSNVNSTVHGIDIALQHVAERNALPPAPLTIFLEIFQILKSSIESVYNLVSLNPMLHAAIIISIIITSPIWVVIVIPVFSIFGIGIYVHVTTICYGTLFCGLKVLEIVKNWKENFDY
ncbi:hypothetical protein G9A89_023143 [Geosiphon pyriformis]|nr:hypothetical protein G9A89_023143 [Geosiphon pyriformis]